MRYQKSYCITSRKFSRLRPHAYRCPMDNKYLQLLFRLVILNVPVETLCTLIRQRNELWNFCTAQTQCDKSGPQHEKKKAGTALAAWVVCLTQLKRSLVQPTWAEECEGLVVGATEWKSLVLTVSLTWFPRRHLLAQLSSESCNARHWFASQWTYWSWLDGYSVRTLTGGGPNYFLWFICEGHKISLARRDRRGGGSGHGGRWCVSGRGG